MTGKRGCVIRVFDSSLLKHDVIRPHHKATVRSVELKIRYKQYVLFKTVF